MVDCMHLPGQEEAWGPMGRAQSEPDPHLCLFFL